MNWGTTFAHPYLRDYFKLPVIPAFSELLKINFQYVRLGCYWNEIEKKEGVFNFREIEELLSLAETKQQKVILTIGMKAPRHPEFYVPGWTNVHRVLAEWGKLRRFIGEAVKRLNHFQCVAYWQVENEPLDPSGPEKLVIPSEILQNEVNLVRQLSHKPILLTLWGNKSLKDSRLFTLTQMADVVGIDLYYYIPNGNGGYWGPKDNAQTIKEIAQQNAKPIWITELQSNPWKDSPNLRHEEILEQNWQRAKEIGVPTTLFWGFEYWYALKSRGKSAIWNQILKKVPTT